MPYDASRDPFRSRAVDLSHPGRRVVAITPSDIEDLPIYARSLYIGKAGDLFVIPIENEDDTPVPYRNRPIGEAPVGVRRVFQTGTTAEFILGYIY